VSDYLTDDEQAEAVKRWLRENALALVGGLVLGLGGLFGWNQWQGIQQGQAEQASAIYDRLLVQASLQRIAEAEEALLQLERDFARTGYPDQARLAIAGMHMERNMPAQASAHLEAVLAGRASSSLKHVARLRLARVLLYQEQPEAALALLAVSDTGEFTARYHEVRGDAHAEAGNLEQARREYEQALATDQRGLVDRGYVQAKLADIRVAGPDELVLAEPVPLPGLFN
jgi:predicted negative regulator of RcsB-dependent stress response